MELQAVTASAAAGLTLITIALFMLGMYLTARRDLCTGYWAIASVLMAIGTVAPFPLFGTPLGRPAIWFAATTFIAGGVFWWWGLRLFFGRSVHAAGWWIISLNSVVVGVLFAVTWVKEPRLIVFASAAGLTTGLVIVEALRGDGKPWTVGRLMIALSYSLTFISLVTRSLYFLSVDRPVTPLSNDGVNVSLLYLVPMMGELLGAVGTLLMYFERTVAEKDHLATHDDLTQLYNRRALTAAGQQSLEDAGIHPLSVLLIDIDHFKAVNDTLGHEAGDRLLCTVARALADNCRRTDLIGRHGGEEFCIVCPATDAADALKLGERLLKAVESVQTPGGLRQPFSISIGIATRARPSEDAPDWDGLLRLADQALYGAKKAGRNQVAFA
jgi:diguanylate cyclase (GGDEF)-like protein